MPKMCVTPGCPYPATVVGVDTEGSLTWHFNPKDELTSTVSYPLIYGEFCYFCQKVEDNLIQSWRKTR